MQRAMKVTDHHLALFTTNPLGLDDCAPLIHKGKGPSGGCPCRPLSVKLVELADFEGSLELPIVSCDRCELCLFVPRLVPRFSRSEAECSS
jgi:hypothetical protein